MGLTKDKVKKKEALDTSGTQTYKQDIRGPNAHTPSKARGLTSRIRTKVNHPCQRGIRSANGSHPYGPIIQTIPIYTEFLPRSTRVHPYMRRVFL